MKKYILRLGICAGLLAVLLLLTMLIHNGMDAFVVSRQPNQSTTVEAPPTVTMSDLTDLDDETDEDQQQTPDNTTQTTTPGTTTTPETTTPETTTPETTTPETTTPETTTPETTTPETTTPETTTPETTTPETTTPETTTPGTTTTPETTTPETTTPGTTTTPETTTPPAEDEKKKPQGQAAPVVTFYNAAGNAVTIESFRDKPVVLCYWASWATGSDDTLDLINQYYAEYSEKVHFVVINLTNAEKETREAADAYLAEKNYAFPVYYDTDGVCRTSYSVNTVPTTFFLEDDAYAVAYSKGKLTKRVLLAGIEYILKEALS